MTNEEREKKQEQFKQIIDSNIIAIVRDAMGFHATGKTTFRTKVTFQKLIDYKFSDENETQKFQRFLSMADNIVENIQLMFPFINLNGIDLSWTTEELQNKVFEIFEMTPEMNLQNCPRLSEEERKALKKEKNRRIKELETKLETYLRQFCNVPDDAKISKRTRIYELLKTHVPDKGEYEKKEKYCNGNRVKTTTGDWKYQMAPLERDIKDLFHDVENLYVSSYSNFSDIMSRLKDAYKIR